MYDVSKHILKQETVLFSENIYFMVPDLKQTIHKQVALSSHVPVALVVHNSYCNLSHLRAKSISSSYLFKDKRVFTNH